MDNLLNPKNNILPISQQLTVIGQQFDFNKQFNNQLDLFKAETGVQLPSNITPDVAARNLYVARSLNIPEEQVEQNPDYFANLFQTRTTTDIIRSSGPAMASLVANERNYQAQKYNLRELSRWEKIVGKDVTIPETVGTAILGTLSGATDIVSRGTSGIKRWLADRSMNEALKLQNLLDAGLIPDNEIEDTQRLIETRLKDANYIFSDEEGDITDRLRSVSDWLLPEKYRNSIFGNLSYGVGNVLGFSAVNAVPAIGTALVFVSAGGMAYDEFYEESSQDSPSVAARLYGGQGYALSSAALEFIPIQRLGRTIRSVLNPTLTQRGLNALITAGSEGVTEFTQSLALDLSRMAYTNPNAEFDFENAAYEGALGTLSMGVVMGGARLYRNRAQSQQAEAQRRYAEDISKYARSSEALKTSPESFSDYIQNVGQEAGKTTVYIPISSFNTYFQEQDINPKQVASQLFNDNGEIWENATASDQDLAIPIEQYVSKLAGTDHGLGLANDTRFSEKSMTYNESLDYSENIDSEEVRKLVDLGNQLITEDNELKQLSNDILSDLRQIKPLTESKNLSQLYSSFFYTLSKRTGTSINDLYNLYKPNFSITLDEQLASTAQTVDASINTESPVSPVVESRNNPRGAFFVDENNIPNISLGSNQNLSTFLHETGHYFLYVYDDISRKQGVPQAINDDINRLKAWMKIPQDAQFTTENHEMFARAFEKYLETSIAPTSKLRNLFRTFSRWLKHVYGQVINNDIDIELSDDVRGVLDRMLTPETDIEIQSLDNLIVFRNAEEAGMSEAEFQQYLDNISEERERAIEEAQVKIFQRLKTERNKKSQAAINKIHQELLSQYAEPKTDAIVNYLRNQQAIDPESVRLRLGQEAVDQMPAWALNENGLDISEIADAVGENSVKTVHENIISYDERQAQIREAAERLYESRNPQLSDENLMTRAQTIAARENSVNQKVTRRLQEAEIIRRYLENNQEFVTANDLPLSSYRVPTIDDVRSAANQIVSTLRIRDVRPRRYAANAIRSSRKAFSSWVNKNPISAFNAKIKEMLNIELQNETKKVDEIVKRTLGLVKRTQQSQFRKELARAQQGSYLDQIDALIASYDLKQRTQKDIDSRRKLVEFIRTAEENNVNLNIDDTVVSRLDSVNYQDITVDEFLSFSEALNSLVHQARQHGKLSQAFDRANISDISTQIANRILQTQPKESIGLSYGETKRLNRFRSLKQTLRDGANLFLRPLSVVRILDGHDNFGPAYTYIYEKVSQAFNIRDERIRKSTDDVRSIYEKYYNKEELNNISEPTFKFGFYVNPISRADLLSIALNYGNIENRNALINSQFSKLNNLTDAEYREMINALDKKDLDFVQDIWNYIDSFYPEIEKKERSRTGLSPTKVLASSLETRHGTYAGGYYPLIYDRRIGETSATQNEIDMGDISIADVEQMMRGNFIKAQTQRGHIKERVGSNGRNVALGLSAINTHIYKVISDLEIGDALNDSWRILNNRKTKDAFSQVGRQDLFENLNVWLLDSAVGKMPSGGIIGTIRNNVTASKIGFKFGTALLQFTGLAQTAGVIGPRYITTGLLKLFSRNHSGEGNIFDQINEMSLVMRNRQTVYNPDVSDVVNFTGDTLAKRFLRTKIGKFAFALSGMTQRLVDCASFLGAYEKGLDDYGSHDQALRYAEQVVQQAQGGGTFADRAALERGTIGRNSRLSQWNRSAVMFATYFISKFNNVLLGFNQSRLTGEYTHLTRQIFYGVFIEAILTALFRGDLPAEDEDAINWALTKFWFGSLETIPIVGQGVASKLQGFGSDTGSLPLALDAVALALNKIPRFVEAINEGNGDEVFESSIKTLSTLMGAIYGIPSSQINQTIGAFLRDSRGEDVQLIEYLMYVEK